MKVLQIIDGYSFNGIAKLLVDIENNIDKDIKFEYLTAIDVCDRFHNLNISRKTIRGRLIFNDRLYKFLKKNKYDIVHINSGAFFFTFFCVIIARICKVKRVIVHSHNTPKINIIKKILIKILNPFYRSMIDVRLACSKDASKSLFTKDSIILKNGIDIDKYKYNEKTRNKIRKELGIENKTVYGHVGCFNKQKNQEFLIDLFNELKDNSILLLIGTGRLESKVKLKAKKLKLEDKVLFLGYRNDIGDLLSAMDVFLFPSIYDGLGISVIEAQASGLPVYASLGVPDEANISSFTKINSFNVEDWVDSIEVKKINRVDAYKKIKKAGYDIKDTTEELEKIYKDLV